MFRIIFLYGFVLIGGCASSGEYPHSRPTEATLDNRGVYEEEAQRDTTPETLRHAFAHLQPWSFDSRYFLTVALNTGHAHVLRTDGLKTVLELPNSGHRWIGESHQLLMMHEDSKRGAVLFRYDLTGKGPMEPMELGHPGLRISRSYRETSRSGQWVAVYIDKGLDGPPRILTVDLDTSEVVVDRPVRAFGCSKEPKWVGVDPNGKFLMVQSREEGEALCEGLWAYDIESGDPVRQITTHTQEGSFGVDYMGYPYFLSTEIPIEMEGLLQIPTRYWLDGRPSEALGNALPVGSVEHVSCVGGDGDPCLISGGTTSSGEYNGRLWWLYDDGQNHIIGPHHAGGCHIWADAQGVVGPEGQYAFATHDGNCGGIHSQLNPSPAL